ncbi:MAG: CRISPR-associated protein Csx15 [Chloroflexota bacterium]|nr:CRISPR-associated protein Csx15 [Chloroflexota bacterium]
MHILNFAHPLTPRQIDQLTALVGSAPERIQDVRVQLDLQQPFPPQIVRLLDDLGITPSDWQSGGWLIVLPSLNYGASVLLAELHGRMGHFPAILRLRPVVGAVVTEYDAAEIINLEAVRAEARMRR